MYITRAITDLSLAEIGAKFGGRDHTTVMHAVRVIEDLRQTDPGIGEDVELLKRLLGG